MAAPTLMGMMDPPEWPAAASVRNRLEGFAGRGDRLADVRFRMSQAHEKRFELGRGQVYAALQHGVEEPAVAAGVAGHGVGVVPNRPVVEEEARHAADPCGACRNPG